MDRLKIGIVGIAAIASLVVVGTYFHARMREKDEALVEQTDRIARLEAENERLSNLVVNAKSDVLQPSEPSGELLRLRGELGVLRQHTNELGGLRQENLRLSQAVAESETNQLSARDQFIVRQNHAVDATTALLQALKTYATSHNGEFPASLDQLVTAGDLKATNLPGNLGPSDFEYGQSPGTNPRGVIVTLRVPIANPGGGGVVVWGGINELGQPYTQLRSSTPD